VTAIGGLRQKKVGLCRRRTLLAQKGSLNTFPVTELSREIPPFGVDGGGPGAVGVNAAELPDGTRVPLKGND
jgi:N-methylhydantoinase B/oxoprolinase/acetone carboxylase alpha subunit